MVPAVHLICTKPSMAWRLPPVPLNTAQPRGRRPVMPCAVMGSLSSAPTTLAAPDLKDALLHAIMDAPGCAHHDEQASATSCRSRWSGCAAKPIPSSSRRSAAQRQPFGAHAGSGGTAESDARRRGRRPFRRSTRRCRPVCAGVSSFRAPCAACVPARAAVRRPRSKVRVQVLAMRRCTDQRQLSSTHGPGASPRSCASVG